MATVFAVAAPRRAALLGFLAASAVAFTGTGASLPDMQLVYGSQNASSGYQWYGSLNAAEGADLSRLGAMAATSGAPLLRGCPEGAEPGTVVACAVADEHLGRCGEAPGDWMVVADFSGTSFGAGVLLAALCTAVFAVWSGHRLAHRFGRGLAHWLPAVFIAAALLGAEFWLFTTGFRLGPLGLAVAVGLLTWPATVAYRSFARVGAAVLTTLVFLGVLWLCEPTGWNGGWIVLATVLTGYAHMILLGTVDVLAPRPRETSSLT